jgi:uncharacterized membrane protein YeiH
MLRVIEVLGILAFTLSGVIEAQRKKMDFVGTYAIAFLTALGGGTLRDLLLNRRPFWLAREEYPLMIMAVVVGALIVLRFKKITITEQAIVIPDGLGLGLFTANGVAYALDMRLPPFVCILMGVITATFGGVLRDIACNEIPVIFRRTELYATCAFFAAAAYWGERVLGVGHLISVTTSIVIAFALRMAAVRFNLKLPL